MNIKEIVDQTFGLIFTDEAKIEFLSQCKVKLYLAIKSEESPSLKDSIMKNGKFISMVLFKDEMKFRSDSIKLKDFVKKKYEYFNFAIVEFNYNNISKYYRYLDFHVESIDQDKKMEFCYNMNDTTE